MKIDYLYAAMNVSDLHAATNFYTKVLARPPDDTPMPTLTQWRGFGNAGIQLFLDAGKAGSGRMTIVVANLGDIRAALQKVGLALGPVSTGDYGRVAQLSDPDGNLITFAEPPRAQAG